MSTEFETGDLVRVQFIPGYENESLMTKEVHKILNRVRRSDGVFAYLIKTADSSTATYYAENLRLATKEETLVYKICQ